MRIAMLSLHSCPLDAPGRRDTGGMNVYVHELARRLGEKGNPVDIFTTSHPGDSGESPKPCRNVQLVHLPVNRTGGKLGLLPQLPDLASAIAEYASARKLDYKIVHSHYWLSGLVGIQLARQWQSPHVVMLHTSAKAKNAHIRPGADPVLREKAEKNVLASADLIIASTLMERIDLEWMYSAEASKTVIIPCGVDLKMFHPYPKDEARRELNLSRVPVFLYVGRLERGKGIEFLLEGLALAGDSRARLLIVGGDRSQKEYLFRLQAIARKLNIERRVEFIGAVPHERLPVYYSAADACVLPSRYETFGMVGLESLACGTPVIASPVGAMPGVIKHGRNGLLMGEPSADEVAAAMNLMLTEPGLTDRMRAAARDSVWRYDWDEVARKVVQQYGRLLRKKKSPASGSSLHTESEVQDRCGKQDRPT